MDSVIVTGIYVRDGNIAAPVLQPLLTKYGCVIKTRLGLHNVNGTYADAGGLLILELSGDPNEVQRFEKDLAKVHGIEVQKMCFLKDNPGETD